MALSPLEKGYQHKKAELLKLVNLTEEQRIIIDVYLMEEQTGQRHWEWDPEDTDIYIEWLNGTTKLRNRINMLSAMDRNQKAMYNRSMTPNTNTNQNGSSPFPQQPRPTGGPQQSRVTSSGRVLTSETHPNLFKPVKRRTR